MVRAFGVGFAGNPAIRGCCLGCVCLDTGFGRAPTVLAAVDGVCVWVWVLPALRFFLVWELGRVASRVRPVRFRPPSCGAACGVGVCGGCCGWGLSPCLPPPLFFPGCRGGCGSRPWPVVTLWCPTLPVPVLGLLLSVPPSPFVWVASIFLFCPSFLRSGVCLRVLGVLSSGGPLLSAGCLRVWQGGPPVFLQGVPSVSPLVLPGWGICLRLVEWLRGFRAVCLSLAPPFFRRARSRGSGDVSPPFCAVCLFPPPFFSRGGSACSSLCLPWTGGRTGRHLVWLTGLLLVQHLAGPCPGPMGRVAYVHAWPGGLFCQVRF